MFLNCPSFHFMRLKTFLLVLKGVCCIRRLQLIRVGAQVEEAIAIFGAFDRRISPVGLLNQGARGHGAILYRNWNKPGSQLKISSLFKFLISLPSPGSQLKFFLYLNFLSPFLPKALSLNFFLSPFFPPPSTPHCPSGLLFVYQQLLDVR